MFSLFGKKKEEKKEEEFLILPEEFMRAGELSLKEVIAPSALEIKPNFIRIGERVARTIFFFSYPRYLHTNWFSPIINLDKIFDISMFVHPIDTSVVLRELRKRVARVQSQIASREEKGLVRDPVLDTAYHDLEAIC